LVTSVISRSDGKKISIPWFILFFIATMLINTYFLTDHQEVSQFIAGIARKGLIITMFFIGASLSVDIIKSVGTRPLLQGVLLWIIISVASLVYILLR
jgi:uncharacterized membrane protein YadS